MIPWLVSLLAKNLGFDYETIMNMSYPLVLQYLHSILILNGINTKWTSTDESTAAEDKKFIDEIL